MTATAETMTIAEIADIAISKADTIAATGAAIITGGWAWRTRASNAKLTDAQAEKTAVDMMVTVANEVRADLSRIKADLSDCEATKRQMRSDFEAHKAAQDIQMKALEDRQMRMAEAMAQAFKAQGHKVNPKINLDLL